MTITNEPDLSGREAYLANKECEVVSKVLENEQDRIAAERAAADKIIADKAAADKVERARKGIDWAEFDKQDQIIMSSND